MTHYVFVHTVRVSDDITMPKAVKRSDAIRICDHIKGTDF